MYIFIIHLFINLLHGKTALVFFVDANFFLIKKIYVIELKNTFKVIKIHELWASVSNMVRILRTNFNFLQKRMLT